MVALSKWSRLLALSPRALGRGYAWKDTIAHEYVHLVRRHAIVDSVVFVDDEDDGPAIWTVVIAPPFDSVAVRPVYEAQAKLLGKAPCDVDVRLVNKTELIIPIEQWVPPGRVVFERRRDARARRTVTTA